MSSEILGIHHVTAIASDPQRNVDFYTGLLGLRLVKVTVNFDDPGTYHLYYGDQQGHPGTILTFFPWPQARTGRKGIGQTTIVSFAVPMAALRYWAERLEDYKVTYEGPIARFGDRVITFYDPDDLQIELVGLRNLEDGTERIGPIPAEYAIQGIWGITLAEEEKGPTEGLLVGLLGFRPVDETGNRYRYQVGHAPGGGFVDLLAMPGMLAGDVAAGSIHHVAWRTATDQAQQAWRKKLAAGEVYTTPVMDRQYFRSIYFREPGGALFEIATDPPGFAIDEPLEQLGTHLMLPPWLEPRREAIEDTLPPLRLPELIQSI